MTATTPAPAGPRRREMSVEAYRSTITEAELQAVIIAMARQMGFLVYHTAVSIRSGRGYPDLTIVGHGRLIVIEAKSARGRVRPGQQAWIDAFAAVPGVVARIVRPSDLDDVLRLLAESTSLTVTS